MNIKNSPVTQNKYVSNTSIKMFHSYLPIKFSHDFKIRYVTRFTEPSCKCHNLPHGRQPFQVSHGKSFAIKCVHNRFYVEKISTIIRFFSFKIA